MKIHRFINNFDLSQKETEITGEIAHQIIKVLKLKVGEKIELSDGKGSVGFGIIKNINKNIVLVEIEQTEKITENKKTTLFCAVLKKENFELVVQKATETGISKIVPIISARTIKTGLNLERLQKIAKEASEQSGRSIMPEILEPISFSAAVDTVGGQGKKFLNILFDASGKELCLGKHCADCRAEHSNSSADEYACFTKHNSLYNIFIGPEGGWTTEEIEKIKSLNFKIASLGSLTLRAETAAIISSYLISNLK